MRQKTIYIDPTDLGSAMCDFAEHARIGDEVILVEYTDVKRGGNWFTLVQHKGKGIPGNLDRTVCRYHGWRGTTEGLCKDAHGVRRIIDIRLADWHNASSRMIEGKPLRRCDMHKIVVGPDIHPDWD